MSHRRFLVSGAGNGFSFGSRSELAAWPEYINGAIYSDGTVLYKGSTGATDIPDLPGLAPFGEVTREHFSTDSDFNAWATSKGYDYPTPNIVRFDLPPQRINLSDVGVVHSNLLADATNNVEAIQAVIDWLTSKTNGGTIHGGVFDRAYSNPIITINDTLILKPKVSFNFSRDTRFRAAAAMGPMVDSTTGAGRLQYISVTGGFWDAGTFAECAFHLREFQHLYFGGPHMTVYGGTTDGVRFGDATVTSGTNGLYMVEGLSILNAVAHSGHNAGVNFVGNVSDSEIFGLAVIGWPIGLQGRLFGSKLIGGHTWSAPGTQGPHDIGLDLSGDNLTIVGMQVDNPHVAGIRITSGGNYYITNSRFVFDQNAVGSIPTDTIYAVDTSVNNIRVALDGVYVQDTADVAVAGLWRGSGTGEKFTVSPSCRVLYGPTPLVFRRGYPESFARAETGVGTVTATVETNGTLSRTADGDYTFTFTTPMPDAEYRVLVEVQNGNTPLATTVHSKSTTSFRVQFYSIGSTPVLTRPARFSVEAARP